jgi:hypothetical protein
MSPTPKRDPLKYEHTLHPADELENDDVTPK